MGKSPPTDGNGRGMKLPELSNGVGPELRARIVAMIEDVVHLHEEADALGYLIVRAEIRNAIAWRKSLAEIIDAIWLVEIVLVAAREAASYGVEVHVNRQFRHNVDICISLEKITRDLRDAVAGVDGDVAVHSQSTVAE